MRHPVIAAIVEFGLVVLAAAGAAVSWNHALRTTAFAPFGDAPGYTATRYAPPWLLLGALLVIVAGLFAIDATTRIVGTLRVPAAPR